MAGNASAAPLSCVSKEEADTFVQFPMTFSGVLSVTQYVSPPVFGDVPMPPLSRSLIIQYLGIPQVGTKNNRREREKFTAALTFRLRFLRSNLHFPLCS